MSVRVTLWVQIEPRVGFFLFVTAPRGGFDARFKIPGRNVRVTWDALEFISFGHSWLRSTRAAWHTHYPTPSTRPHSVSTRWMPGRASVCAITFGRISSVITRTSIASLRTCRASAQILGSPLQRRPQQPRSSVGLFGGLSSCARALTQRVSGE